MRGAQNTPHPPSTPALPRGPWETLSHTRGYQNSSLVLNYGPFEAMPRKIPCRRMVLRTWSSQVRSLRETRTAGNISGVVYSIYLTFLLIGMCLLGELGNSRMGPGARKPRHGDTLVLFTHKMPLLSFSSCYPNHPPWPSFKYLLL